MSPKKETHLPPAVLWSALACVVFIAATLVAEGLLRLFVGPWTASPFFQPDATIGHWHRPGIVADNIQPEFAIRGIHINQYGMRDKPRSLARQPGVVRIAFLGDSFVEGIQVSDDQVLTRRMEALLEKEVEVLNFGLSDSGSVQHQLIYESKVRQFKPDVVVLGFLSANDMRNNSLVLQSLYSGGREDYRPFFLRQPDGSWRRVPPGVHRPRTARLRRFAFRHSALYRFAGYLRMVMASRRGRVLGHRPIDALPKEERVAVTLARLSAPPQGPSIQEAWDVTEHVLVSLAQSVEADGGRFVLAALPGPLHLERDPKAAFKDQFGDAAPPGFDVDYPERRLEQLASKVGFPFCDLVPVFRAYRDEHSLRPPFFSYRRDPHWGPIGHELAARSLSRCLSLNGLFPRR